ncbi:MAG TPA: FAD-dependent oxidoreductase [Candidatus Saccharimonadales bacterium]|nr:FAD-dependent oxidoreductase [Candidatus Saccharimonadales bacterium]
MALDVTFDHAEPVTRSSTTYWFKPLQPSRYIAGQFIELHLPHANADSRGTNRWFTLSSSPTEPLLGVTTKTDRQKGSSFKRALAALRPGARLTFAEPMGDFVLPKDTSIPLVFVAAGIGITPVRSMIRWLHDTRQKRAIQLLYAETTPEELAFLPLFGGYDMQLTPLIKKPTKSYQGETGSLTQERILPFAQADERSLIYISGPELLVETLVHALAEKGIDKQRLVADYYLGYTNLS